MGHSEQRTLKGALLGTGSIAQFHMPAWQAIREVEMVAVADTDLQRARAFASAHGVDPQRVYSDHTRLLASETLDFVDVATPPHCHRDHVLAVAGAGVHVLCQKPFATSLADAQEMTLACRRAGVRCVVNENWRWRPWYREVKRLIDHGTIGTPRYAAFCYRGDEVLPRADGSLPAVLERQQYAAQMPRLILLEWGIHLIDVLRFLLGPVDRVSAEMSRTSELVQGEDRATVTLRFATAAIGVIDISWGTPIDQQQRLVRGCYEPFVVEGDRGSVQLDFRPDDVFTVTDEHRRRKVHLRQSPQDRMSAYQDSFRATQQHFVTCLQTGAVAENEAEDNLHTLAIMLAAYAAADGGRTLVPRTQY